MKFGGNSQRSLHRLGGVRKVNFPFSSIFSHVLSRLLSTGRRSVGYSPQHGPGCMLMQLFLKPMAICLLNSDLVSVWVRDTSEIFTLLKESCICDLAQ